MVKSTLCTARKDAVAITTPDLAPLGGRGQALGPPLVHGVANLVVEGHDHFSVTDQAPGHVR